MIKSAIHRVLRSTGYDLRRIPRASRAYPYVAQIKLTGGDFSFWIKDFQAEQWYSPEVHGTLVENQLLADLVKPGDRVLDLGCHQGFYVAFLAKLVGPSGFVVGVDINPENVMITQAQILLNGLAGNAEVLHRAAAATFEGELKYSHFSDNAMVIMSEHDTAPAAHRTSVDHLSSIYGDFDVVMIDVEGFEEEVLKGAKGLLERKKPKLAVEIHSDFLPGYGATMESLASAGRFSEYSGNMVIRSIDRMKSVPFTMDTVPGKGVANVFLTPR
jgi:FkbM family methyltransferase